MDTRSRHSLLHWALSVSFVLVSVALIGAWHSVPPGSFGFSPSAATADVSETGRNDEGDNPVLIGFSDATAGTPGFIDSLVVANDNADHVVNLSAVGLVPGAHDTLQILLNYDPSIIEITAITCAGLFQGAFSPSGAVVIALGQSAFMCGQEGGVAEEGGIVMRLSLRRIATGVALLDLSGEGEFGSRVFEAGEDSPVTRFSPLAIHEPITVPTATPTTAPSVDPSGGGSSGGGGARAPTPTLSTSVPGAPTNLIAVPGDRSVQLSWNPPSSNGGSAILEIVVRSSDGKINRVFPSAQNPVIVPGLENGVEYSFRIQAINGVGAGIFSEFSNPVIPAGPPSPPDTISAEIIADSGQVSLEWTEPLDLNGAQVDSYTISESRGLIATYIADSGTLSHTFTDLAPGEYQFLITASSRGGTSTTAGITVIMPVILEAPVEPSPEDSPGHSEEETTIEIPVHPAVEEASAQFGIATGTDVVLTDGSMALHPQDDLFRIVLSAETSPASTSAPSAGGFTGFSLNGLTVEAENSRPSVARFGLGDDLEISGSVTLYSTDESVSAELHNLRLTYSPTLPPVISGEQRLAESPVFVTAIDSLTGLPVLTVDQLEVIGTPELPAAPVLRVILAALGWHVEAENPNDQHVAGPVWKIGHSEGVFDAGDTTLFFTLGTLGLPAIGKHSLVAIKQDHMGAIHARSVTCEQITAGPTRCSAVFDGKSGGLSTFAVLEGSFVEPMSDTGLASSVGDGYSAVSTPETALVPTPLPAASPAPAATLDTPDTTEQELESENVSADPTGSTSIVALVALAAAGVITMAGISGYLLSHRKSWQSPTLPLIVIPIAAAALIVFATASNADIASVNASGVIVSQGDVAQHSDSVRTDFGVDGTGVTVGIISDSFGCDTTALAADFGAGELPANLDLSEDVAPILCPFTTDRGRAIAQVIHDVAPGANILFTSAVAGKSALQAGIQTLIDRGADIIIDDLLFGDELIFQDDEVTQAIDQASASGIVYITSAGDKGIAAYDSVYVPGNGVSTICGDSGECTQPANWHDFDPGPGVDHLLSISLTDDLARLMLQWEQPAELGGGVGSSYDLDLYLFDQAGEEIGVSDGSSSYNGDPHEALNATGPGSVQVAVSLAGGTATGLIKLLVSTGAVIEEYATNSSSIVGHRNSAGAITVGPVNYLDTSAFGGVPTVDGSAPLGGTEILFDSVGNELVSPVIRQKPDILAPTGVDTTLGPFDGSAASAAHTAGAVALLLELRADLHSSGQLTPETIRQLLTLTAINVGAPGPDLASGHGLIDVFAAASLLQVEPPFAEVDAYAMVKGESLSVIAPGVLVNDTDQDVPGLIAEVWTEPANGDLVLQTDGSFVYTPNAGFSGEDSFAYVANDGTFTSAPAIVTITIASSRSLSTSVGLQGVKPLANFGTDVVSFGLWQDQDFYEVLLVPGGSQLAVVDGLGPERFDLVATAPGYLDSVAQDVAVVDVAGGTIFVTPVELVAGDANSDGVIDSSDAGIVSAVFGIEYSPGDRRIDTGEITDINGDGVTSGADASLAISNIGIAEPVAWPE